MQECMDCLCLKKNRRILPNERIHSDNTIKQFNSSVLNYHKYNFIKEETENTKKNIDKNNIGNECDKNGIEKEINKKTVDTKKYNVDKKIYNFDTKKYNVDTKNKQFNLEKWEHIYDISEKSSINYKSILELNQNIIGIECNNHVKRYIYLINHNNIITHKINIIKKIGKGSFNNIYEINIDNNLDKYVLSIYNVIDYKNIQNAEKIKIIDKDIRNFIDSYSIHKILDDLSNQDIKYVPNIYNIFFTYSVNKDLLLCKLYEKYTLDGYYYLKDLYIKNNQFKKDYLIWLNYLSQIIYKLYLMQEKYKFSHSDLKPNNTMGNYVKNKIINYKINNGSQNIDFNIPNFGINWCFIDFGFSSLIKDDKYIKSNEYTDNKIIFNKARDTTLFFYSLLKFHKLPIKIENLLKDSLLNVYINKIKYEFLPEKINYKLEDIYDLTYIDEFENHDCEPFVILKKIETFYKKEFLEKYI